MARFLLLLTVFSSGLAFSISNGGEHLTGKELVDILNTKQKLFKAELSNLTMKEMQMRAMKGEYAVFKRDPSVPVAEEIEMDDHLIPESFDFRAQWPNCASIHKIWDQSNCGSCWAFSSSEVMSDRTCIATGEQILLSPADILACCPNCGMGCNGGNPQRALAYWATSGVVTGGDYGSTGNCKPYQFHPCGYHGQNYRSCPNNYATPQCWYSCQQGYPNTYQQDKHYGANSYYIDRSVAAIQKEIMTYGPVNGCFSLYEDFNHYKSGIYVHTGGKFFGGHCAKTIGWGVENGIPYWLAVNSWSADWGENGYFRILRGFNELGYEAVMSAGRPRV